MHRLHLHYCPCRCSSKLIDFCLYPISYFWPMRVSILETFALVFPRNNTIRYCPVSLQVLIANLNISDYMKFHIFHHFTLLPLKFSLPEFVCLWLCVHVCHCVHLCRSVCPFVWLNLCLPVWVARFECNWKLSQYLVTYLTSWAVNWHFLNTHNKIGDHNTSFPKLFEGNFCRENTTVGAQLSLAVHIGLQV